MSDRLTKFAQQVADEEVQSLRAEVARLRLTDAEREAVADICELAEDFLGDDDPNIATLRGLLNRIGGGR